MSIIQFLALHWDSVMLVVVTIAVAVVLYRRGQVGFLESLLFALVIKAEREFGGGTGELKRAAVVQWAYERLPKIATLVISRQSLERLLEAALDYAKKKWAANPHLGDYVSGTYPEHDLSTLNGL